VLFKTVIKSEFYALLLVPKPSVAWYCGWNTTVRTVFLCVLYITNFATLNNRLQVMLVVLLFSSSVLGPGSKN